MCVCVWLSNSSPWKFLVFHNSLLFQFLVIQFSFFFYCNACSMSSVIGQRRILISWKMKGHTKHSWCPGISPQVQRSGLSWTRRLLHLLERTTSRVTVIQTCVWGRFFSKMSEVSLSRQEKQFVVVVREKI